MKQIKFLLSLAVALLIVVPVLAQDAPAGWGVSGDAKAVLNYSVDDSKADNSEATSSFSVDDIVINVNFSNGGDISPYLKMQYDKGDENRFWIGGSFKKGNFAGEANVKFDGSTDDKTFVNEVGAATSAVTIPGSSKEIDVDTAWVTYTMGAVEFKFDKGGIWSCDNTFKVTYTASDMVKVYFGISQPDIQMPTDMQDAFKAFNADFTVNDDLSVTPLYNVGTSVTSGKLAFNLDAAYAAVTINDYKQSFEYGDMNGESYMFFEIHTDVTATIAEGMSVKVYGGYGLNLDSFGNDSGYDDDDAPGFNEFVSIDNAKFKDTVSMKFGAEAKAMGAKVTFDYKSIDDASADAVDSDYKVALSYDAKIGELTLTPGVAYKDNMKNKADLDEGTELDVTLTAAVAF